MAKRDVESTIRDFLLNELLAEANELAGRTFKGIYDCWDIDDDSIGFTIRSADGKHRNFTIKVSATGSQGEWTETVIKSRIKLTGEKSE